MTPGASSGTSSDWRRAASRRRSRRQATRSSLPRSRSAARPPLSPHRPPDESGNARINDQAVPPRGRAPRRGPKATNTPSRRTRGRTRFRRATCISPSKPAVSECAGCAHPIGRGDGRRRWRPEVPSQRETRASDRGTLTSELRQLPPRRPRCVPGPAPHTLRDGRRKADAPQLHPQP
jgi:hypothetical protein